MAITGALDLPSEILLEFRDPYTNAMAQQPAATWAATFAGCASLGHETDGGLRSLHPPYELTETHPDLRRWTRQPSARCATAAPLHRVAVG